MRRFFILSMFLHISILYPSDSREGSPEIDVSQFDDKGWILSSSTERALDELERFMQEEDQKQFFTLQQQQRDAEVQSSQVGSSITQRDQHLFFDCENDELGNEKKHVEQKELSQQREWSVESQIIIGPFAVAQQRFNEWIEECARKQAARERGLLSRSVSSQSTSKSMSRSRSGSLAVNRESGIRRQRRDVDLKGEVVEHEDTQSYNSADKKETDDASQSSKKSSDCNE